MLLLRLFAIALAITILFVLYLPAANPPERFLDQVRAEHDLNGAFWGTDDAMRILERAMVLHSRQGDLTPAAFSAAQPAPTNPLTEAVSRQMSDVTVRLFRSSYFQGVDAIVFLATYRASSLIQWLPFVAIFVLIACFDGYVVRLIRSKQFQEHSPAYFGLFSIGAILTFALTVVILVLPVSLHPVAFGIAPMLVGILTAHAISHFHT